MMNSTDPKEVLTKRLADLLGFEDGVSDVLEHLLTIESQEDLLEYLSQLLGQGDDNVKSFVEDAGKFRRGENVSIQNADTLLTEKAHHGTNADAGVTISNTSRQETDLKMTTLTPAKHKNGPRQNQKQQATGTSNKAANSRNMKSGKSKNDNPTLTAKSIPSSNDQAGPKAEPKQATREEKEASEPPPKSHPPRGVPSTVCGCFGTVHKPLTNCLYCGRISCHKEGFDFCPFCGLLVEKVDATPPKEGAKNKAWLHKERLLRFDREFARRTVVLDDQEDYYSSTASSWLTKDEQREVQEREDERNKQLHERRKQEMKIVF